MPRDCAKKRAEGERERERRKEENRKKELERARVAESVQFRVEFRAHRDEAHRHNILNSAACDLPSNLCSGMVLFVTPSTSKNPDTVNIEGEKRQARESC